MESSLNVNFLLTLNYWISMFAFNKMIVLRLNVILQILYYIGIRPRLSIPLTNCLSFLLLCRHPGLCLFFRFQFNPPPLCVLFYFLLPREFRGGQYGEEMLTLLTIWRLNIFTIRRHLLDFPPPPLSNPLSTVDAAYDQPSVNSMHCIAL